MEKRVKLFQYIPVAQPFQMITGRCILQRKSECDIIYHKLYRRGGLEAAIEFSINEFPTVNPCSFVVVIIKRKGVTWGHVFSRIDIAQICYLWERLLLRKKQFLTLRNLQLYPVSKSIRFFGSDGWSAKIRGCACLICRLLVGVGIALTNCTCLCYILSLTTEPKNDAVYHNFFALA